MNYMRKYYDYRLWPFELLVDAIRYFLADERQRKIYKYVPCYCQKCELLETCRNEKNNWKCRHGCLIINSR